jgi:hypothetical protein
MAKSETKSIILEHPARQARQIVLEVLVRYNVKVEKVNDSVQGYIMAPEVPSLWSRGTRVQVWIEPMETGKTKIYVDTSKRGSLFLTGYPAFTKDILRSIDNEGKRRK